MGMCYSDAATAEITGTEACALAIAAMQRATKVTEIASKRGKKKPRLEPGTHDVDLTIRITGELNQAVDQAAGEAKTTTTFSDRDLLAAILLPQDDTERRRTLRTAINRMSKMLAKDIEAQLAVYDAEVLELAERAGLTESKKSAAKAGKLEGMPEAHISGTCNGKSVRSWLSRRTRSLRDARDAGAERGELDRDREHRGRRVDHGRRRVHSPAVAHSDAGFRDG